MKSFIKKAKISLGFTLLFYFLPLFLFHHLVPPSIWENCSTYRPFEKLQEFYEKNRFDSPIRQCWNTYSNGAYFFTGIWIFLHFPFFGARIYAISLLILAYGSASFHASLSALAHRLDLLGMYLPLFTLLLFPFSKGQKKLLFLFLLFSLSLAFALLISVWVGYPVLFTLLLFQWRRKKKSPILRNVLLLFCLAFFLQRLDVAKVAPLHWLWHILTAICLYLLLKAYLSQTGPAPSPGEK